MFDRFEPILEDYYLPLINYDDKKIFGGLLSKPLWQLRQIDLQEKRIYQRLTSLLAGQQTESRSEDSFFLVQLIFHYDNELTANPVAFNQLKLEEKTRLFSIANTDKKNPLAAYATSMLVTLFLRDPNLTYRKAALHLLNAGHFSDSQLPLVENPREEHEFQTVNLRLINYASLRDACYIDFSYANFTELGSIQLNLSGQYLKKIMAHKVTFASSHQQNSFRYSCLYEARFEEATFKEKYDFTGASLWKADLTKANIQRGCFKKVNAQGAKLISVKAQGSHWEQASLCYASLIDADFTGVEFKFTDVTSADLTGTKYTKSVLQSLLVDQKAQQAIHAKSIGLSRVLRAEQRQSDPNRFNLWPREEKDWYHDPHWHGKNTDLLLCDLDSSHETYALLEHFIYLTSDTEAYESRSFELSRTMKAIKGGNFISFFFQELFTPSRHLDTIGGIQIHAIQVNHNPQLLSRYKRRKEAIKKELACEGLADPLKFITWKQNSMENLPVLDPSAGEVWLFHGTIQSVVPLIVQNGFVSKAKDFGRGFGPLGRGTYFTDSFAKAATYTQCPYCKKAVCHCPDEEKQKREDKKDRNVLFVSRVILGKVQIHKKQDRHHKEGPDAGYHSIWAPCRDKEPHSAFRQNEFVVRDEAQIYPEFCVFYHDNEPGLQKIHAQEKIKSLFPREYRELEQALLHYQHLLQSVSYQAHAPAFNELKKQVRELEGREGSLEQQQALQKLIGLIKVKEQEITKYQTVHLHYVDWLWDYIAYQEWESLLYMLENKISLADMAPDNHVRLSFLKARARYHCGEFTLMKKTIYQLWVQRKNDVEAYLDYPENEDMRDSYCQEGLKYLSALRPGSFLASLSNDSSTTTTTTISFSVEEKKRELLSVQIISCLMYAADFLDGTSSLPVADYNAILQTSLFHYFSMLVNNKINNLIIYQDFSKLTYSLQKKLLEAIKASYGDTGADLYDYLETRQQADGMSFHIQYEREQWQLDLNALFIDKDQFDKDTTIILQKLPEIKIHLSHYSEAEGRAIKKELFLHPRVVQELLQKKCIDLTGKIHPKDVHQGSESKHSHQNVFSIDVRIAGRRIAVHWKVDPELPGFEKMHNLLSSRISGCGLNQCELVVWRASTSQTALPVLISKTLHQVPPHLNFQGYLMKTSLEDIHSLLAAMDKRACARSLLSLFVVGQNDGKANNYILRRTSRGYSLLSIDNERTFLPAMGYWKNTETGQQEPGFIWKDIQLCLPFLLEPIPLEVREAFLRLDIQSILYSWLEEIEQEELKWRTVLKNQLTRFDDYCYYLKSPAASLSESILAIPVSQQLLKILSFRMHNIKAWLKNPDTDNQSFFDLLAKIEPVYAKEIGPVLQKKYSPEEKFKNLYGKYYKEEDSYFNILKQSLSDSNVFTKTETASITKTHLETGMGKIFDFAQGYYHDFQNYTLGHVSNKQQMDRWEVSEKIIPFQKNIFLWGIAGSTEIRVRVSFYENDGEKRISLFPWMKIISLPFGLDKIAHKLFRNQALESSERQALLCYITEVTGYSHYIRLRKGVAEFQQQHLRKNIALVKETLLKEPNNGLSMLQELLHMDPFCQIMRALDFSETGLADRQEQVIDCLIKSKAILHHLYLNNFSRLTDEKLLKILDAHPVLKRIELDGCTSLTYRIFQKVVRVKNDQSFFSFSKEYAGLVNRPRLKKLVLPQSQIAIDWMEMCLAHQEKELGDLLTRAWPLFSTLDSKQQKRYASFYNVENTENSNADINVFKIVLVGNSATGGKTSLISRFVEGSFTESPSITLAPYFWIKKIILGNKTCELQIWDSAGSTHPSTLITPYFKNVHCIIFGVDLTDELHKQVEWFDAIKLHPICETSNILIGNKSDLVADRKISHGELVNFAKIIGAKACFECSAKTGSNVEKIFHTAAKICLGMKYENGFEYLPRILPTKENTSLNSAKKQTSSSNADSKSFKILLRGYSASGCGKTSLVSRFISDSFREHTEIKMGSECRITRIIFDKACELQIWDTVSHQWAKLDRIYYTYAQCIIFVIDLTGNLDIQVRRELEEIKRNADCEPPIIFIGNKSDLVKDRKISREELGYFAKEMGAKAWLECSAKTGINVEEIFTTAAQICLDLEYEREFVHPKENTFFNSEKKLTERSKFDTKRFKILLRGDSASGGGKTSLVSRFISDSFKEHTEITRFSEPHLKRIILGDKDCELQIWDTIGQPHPKLIEMDYRCAHCIIFVVDLTGNLDIQVRRVLEEIKRYADRQTSIIFIGNKSDLAKDRKISHEELVCFAKEIGAKAWFECSAKTGTNVEEIFHTAAQICLDFLGFEYNSNFIPGY